MATFSATPLLGKNVGLHHRGSPFIRFYEATAYPRGKVTFGFAEPNAHKNLQTYLSNTTPW